MNSADSPQPRSRTRWWLRLLKWYAIAMGLSVLVLGLAAYDAVTLSHDARALRDVIVTKGGAHLESTIQINASEPLLALAHCIVHRIPQAPREAQAALATVKRASVGVYTLREPLSPAAATAVLRATESEMNRRGWMRTVAVLDGKECVSIFVRPSRWSESTQDVCLSVCDDHDVVVISGRADATALAELVRQHTGSIRL